MSDLSPNLALPLLLPAQAQKHVTHNEALALLDLLVQLRVQRFGALAPPEAPEEGEVHALGAGATGAWAGQDGRLAALVGSGWLFIAPREGWRAWDLTDEGVRVYADGEWQPLEALPPGMVDSLGVNAAVDDINRLSVAAPSTLLTHEGAGHQLKINKAATGDTASLLFQTGFSGRAEMGTAGGDDWSIKVSTDGASWTEALRADGATGAVAVPQGLTVGDDTELFHGADLSVLHPPYSSLPLGISHSSVTSQAGDPEAYPAYGGVLTVNHTANRCFQWHVDGQSASFWVRANHASNPSADENWTPFYRIWSEHDQGSGSGLTADKVTAYTVAGLPSAASRGAGALVFVSDEAGGAVLAFSDGTDWRRVTDRAVVS